MSLNDLNIDCCAILEGMSQPVFIRDLEGVFLGCNKAFERLFSFDSKDETGKLFADVVGERFPNEFFRYDDIHFKRHRDQSFDCRINLFGDVQEYVRINLSIYRNNQGDVIGSIGTIIDIDPQIKAENLLDESLNYLSLCKNIINNIAYGVVFFNNVLHIKESNKGFAKILGVEIEHLYETESELRNVDLKKICSFNKYFSLVFTSKDNYFSKDINYKNKVVQLTVYVNEKKTLAVGVLKDMSISEMRNEELMNRANVVKKKHLEAVQKIAYILGENAAQTEEVLNSIVNFNKH